MKTSFRSRITLFAAAGSALCAWAAFAQPRPGGGTVAYWLTAETASGFSANSANPARRPSLMGMVTGQGMPRSDGYIHNLRLDLGSPRRPTAGAPQADHFVPAGLNAGPVLPLVSPDRAPPGPATGTPPGYDPSQVQGRILIYWGCGEHVRPGQPFEIDLSRIARGQVPPAFANLPYRPMQPPSSHNSTTYGEWPNARSRTVQIPADGSLVGAHSIRGNYSPEINFTLAPGQDFLPPIALTSNTRAPSGAVPVAWNPVPGARGYFLMSMGGREDRTMVLWTSSEAQLAMMGLLDYLAPDEVARLVQQRVVLPPSTTQCTVPAEYVSSVQGAMLMMTAFGPETNFSHPAPPPRPPRGWAPEWTVKLRTRATYTGLLGMDMEAMRRGENPQQEQPRRRRSLRDRILGQ